MSWVLWIWVQGVWFVAVFKKFGNGYDSIKLVDGIISVRWKESSEKYCLTYKNVTDSVTEHDKLNIMLNNNICRYDRLEEINIFLDGKSPGIKHCNI